MLVLGAIQPLSFELLLLRHTGSRFTLLVVMFGARSYYQKVCIDSGITLGFSVKHDIGR